MVHGCTQVRQDNAIAAEAVRVMVPGTGSFVFPSKKVASRLLRHDAQEFFQ